MASSPTTGLPWAISTFSAGHAEMRVNERRAARRLTKAMRNLRGTDGSSLLLAEQNLWFARQCTARLYLIDGGRIVQPALQI